MINIKYFDSNLLKIDKKSSKNIAIYYTGYITKKINTNLIVYYLFIKWMALLKKTKEVNT